MTETIVLTTPQGREIATDFATLLTPRLREASRTEANRYIKTLRLAPFGGVPFRERFTFRDDSLWWFTELYLHKMRRIDQAISTVLALESASEAHAPSRITIDTADATVRHAAAAFARQHRIAIDVRGAATSPARYGWQSYQIGLSARLSRLRGKAVRVSKHPRVAAFVHTAFWRRDPARDGPQQESYVGSVLDAVAAEAGDAELFCVGVGPRRNFRARRWWDPLTGPTPHSRLVTPVERLAPASALEPSLTLWRHRDALAREVTTGDGIRDAAHFRQCDLWPVLSVELDAVARVQWPWSARAMDEAGAALDALAPRVVVTYAEAGGWGRALVLEARRRKIPSVGLQHGFIYRHWLNYLHETDEMAPLGADRGCPVPDRTLVFDRYAQQHLQEAGRYPASRVTVTGNARLDQLLAACAALRPIRGALRKEFGVSPAGDQPLAVLAAKFSEIGDVLPDLVAAVRDLTGARLVIKPHPAETAEAYRAQVNGVPNICVAPIEADLARLLTAADAVITMNSTVAIDALALGLPALVIGLPNNLSPFVEAGAMLGADGEADIRRRLESLLYDAQVRRTVIAAGAAFAERFALASSGRAAARSAEEILAFS